MDILDIQSEAGYYAAVAANPIVIGGDRLAYLLWWQYILNLVIVEKVRRGGKYDYFGEIIFDIPSPIYYEDLQGNVEKFTGITTLRLPKGNEYLSCIKKTK